MKTTLDPLANLNRDLELMGPRRTDEHPAAGPAEDKRASRCDRWGHPYLGSGKIPAPANPADKLSSNHDQKTEIWNTSLS